MAVTGRRGRRHGVQRFLASAERRRPHDLFQIARPSAVRLTDGRSGRTSALPYPPGGAASVAIDPPRQQPLCPALLPVTAKAINFGGCGGQSPLRLRFVFILSLTNSHKS